MSESEPTSQPKPTPHKPSQTPNRQIRASFDTTHITVYQAYSTSIASAAVTHQKLNAAPDFRPSRMTWIKPSWCWMMYRSGYSLKDPHQARILAIKISHENFAVLLSQAVVTSGQHALSEEERRMPVRVQWDPERTPRLGVLPYRSIQIGISREVGRKWVEEWVDGIEDVTERALELKRAVEENPKIEIEELVEKGLMPVEREYVLPEELRRRLRMELE
ncbi:unnamed protein product [Calypogeia fissa]